MADESGSGAGGDITSRVTGRLDRSELTRSAVPGAGGEAISGRLASRALRAVGARAMTVDRSVIVDDGFDPSNPEDQALFAHEQYHAQHGDGEGGGGGENFRDAEEIAARAVERMVLHRSAGGYEGGRMPGAGAGEKQAGAADESGRGAGAGTPSATEVPEAEDRKPDPQRGYRVLIAKGMSHADVVDQLARKCMAVLDEQHQVRNDRHQDKKGAWS